MSIRDFHSKLVSAHPENPLFRALRQLSQLEDTQRMLFRNPDGSLLGWGDWSGSPAS